MPNELERIRRGAWQLLINTARYKCVIRQIGWMIDRAESVGDVLRAVGLIGEFEIEEEFARQEVILNAALAPSGVAPTQHPNTVRHTANRAPRAMRPRPRHARVPE